MLLIHLRSILAMLLLSPVIAQAQSRPIVPSGTGSNRVYSPAVDAGDYLYISAQGPRRLDGSLPAKLSEQVQQALNNVKRLVEAAGLNIDHVVYTQVYLEDMNQFDEVDRAFGEYFGKSPPARAVLGVARVPEPPIQISAVAARDLTDRRAIYPANFNWRESAAPGVLTRDRLFISTMGGAILKAAKSLLIRERKLTLLLTACMPSYNLPDSTTAIWCS